MNSSLKYLNLFKIYVFRSNIHKISSQIIIPIHRGNVLQKAREECEKARGIIRKLTESYLQISRMFLDPCLHRYGIGQGEWCDFRITNVQMKSGAGDGSSSNDPEDPTPLESKCKKEHKKPVCRKTKPCECKESSKSRKEQCKQEKDPCKCESDPCKKKKKGGPCKMKKDPCKQTEALAKKHDPCKTKKALSKKSEGKTDPCKKGRKVSEKTKDKQKDPCNKKPDAQKAESKTDPCKKGKKLSERTKDMQKDPCNKKPDSQKAESKTDPCKKGKKDSERTKDMQNDPCKKKPSQKKESTTDPCKKGKEVAKIENQKEDPCKKREESCKPESQKECKPKLNEKGSKEKCPVINDPCSKPTKKFKATRSKKLWVQKTSKQRDSEDYNIFDDLKILDHEKLALAEAYFGQNYQNKTMYGYGKYSFLDVFLFLAPKRLPVPSALKKKFGEDAQEEDECD